MNKGPILLTILDGFGLNDKTNGNAIKSAKTPNLDKLMSGEFPFIKIDASGEAVGLPKGQIGNSEVGHLNIGAGRVVRTGLSLINNEIENNLFEKKETLLNVLKQAKKNKRLHLLGLLSPGGVHSHEEHIFEIIKIANKEGIRTFVHVFGDGRDVPPKSIISSLEKLYEICKNNNAIISTISGRFYAMDRDKRWERTLLAYNNLLGLNKKNSTKNFIEYVNSQYNKNINDEFLEPCYLDTNENIFIDNDDTVIFANFRPDRARQISHALIGSDYYSEDFIRRKNLFLAIMMNYEGINPNLVIYPLAKIENTIGEVVAKNGLSQLRITETEKYAHVTFFMDGGIELNFNREEKILINSPKVETYDLAPEMSAELICDKLLEKMSKFDFIILNFANPDMVGHTGNFEKAVIAIECIDKQIGKILSKINELNGTMFLTADHGNAEIMLDDNNKVVTAHTTSLVPFICTDKKIKFLKKSGKLSNIAPTILKYLGIEIPKEMDESPLI